MSYFEIIINGIPVNLIPLGDCACGCGGKTKILAYDHKERGYRQGQPRRFLRNHHSRLRKGKFNHNWSGGLVKHIKGYILKRDPKHPRASKEGYVLEHILVCEKALGKYLPVGAEPHHIDGNKSNNRNNNLVLCQDRAYHMLLELRTRALKECGHSNWRKCNICKQWDAPENLSIAKKPRGHIYHKKCASKYQRERSISNGLPFPGDQVT